MLEMHDAGVFLCAAKIAKSSDVNKKSARFEQCEQCFQIFHFSLFHFSLFHFSLFHFSLFTLSRLPQVFEDEGHLTGREYLLVLLIAGVLKRHT